jgi:hypothetical protein
MTDDEKRLVWLAFLKFEETMNAVVCDFFEDRGEAGREEELSPLITSAMTAKYEELCEGEGDRLLAVWRGRTALN